MYVICMFMVELGILLRYMALFCGLPGFPVLKFSVGEGVQVDHDYTLAVLQRLSDQVGVKRAFISFQSDLLRIGAS